MSLIRPLAETFTLSIAAADQLAFSAASIAETRITPSCEAALKANWSAAAIDSVKVSASGLMSDIHGTSDYRANLIKVMAQRAVTAAG